MLTLSDAQWSELSMRDTHSFVAAVCDQYLAKRPDKVAVPGRDAVLKLMEDAHGYAVRIGFTNAPHIVRWLYLAADAPGLHEVSVVDYYMRKPGATPEQRLDDMLAVIANELKTLEGSD
jgi:hypothetical protein